MRFNPLIDKALAKSAKLGLELELQSKLELIETLNRKGALSEAVPVHREAARINDLILILGR